MLLFQFLCIIFRQLASLHLSEAITITKTDTALAATISTNSIKDCNACFVEAPIDQLIIGDGAQYYVQLGTFTFNIVGVFSSDTAGGPSLVALPTASIITYDGIPIGNPTMYNIITGYRMVALTEPSGTCISTVLSTVELASAYSIPIPSSASSDFITDAESIFITSIGLSTCNVAVVVSTTVPSGVTDCSTDSFLGLNDICSPTGNNISQTTTTTTTRVTTSTSASTPSNSTTHTFTTPTSSNSDSGPAMSNIASGLSQSAKIGISIGASIIGVITLATIGMLVLKRKARRTRAPKDSHFMVELPSKEPKTTTELESRIVPQELPVDRPPELP